MTEKIPSPADALHALTEAMLVLDLSLSVHSIPVPRPIPAYAIMGCKITDETAQICLMHTGEIMNRIQKIRGRIQND